MKAMTDAVHEQGGKIVLQLAHGGIFADSDLTEQAPVAPSAVAGKSKVVPREMTTKDIREVVEAFGDAASRAKQAAFDGVQIHSAHGYLLSEFLSPIFNHRSDEYGGSIENRARVLLEVLQTIRSRVGSDYPIIVKINFQDFYKNGLKLEESLQVGTMLVEGGIDAIELSGGLPTSRKLSPVRMGIKSEDKEAYHQMETRAFKQRVRAPLIMVGGVRSYHLAERLVDEEVADYISMSRPFIREPGLINRWRSGDLKKATCVSDNRCFGPARTGEGIYCVTEAKED
jgi:2,4-dienoyl-CoA reductase-like NADH-dependent reductase (Old Yellow Enzyme family)